MMTNHENKYRTLGEFLRAKRKQFKKSQAELAKEIGVNRATLSMWETGSIRNIETEHFLKCAIALDFDPLAVHAGNFTRKQIPPSRRIYIDKIKSMPDDKFLSLKALIDLIDGMQKLDTEWLANNVKNVTKGSIKELLINNICDIEDEDDIKALSMMADALIRKRRIPNAVSDPERKQK